MFDKDGESMTSVTLYIHDDTTPEDTEHVFVYVSALTEGVRVAMPNIDDGKKVYICDILVPFSPVQCIEVLTQFYKRQNLNMK